MLALQKTKKQKVKSQERGMALLVHAIFSLEDRHIVEALRVMRGVDGVTWHKTFAAAVEYAGCADAPDVIVASVLAPLSPGGPACNDTAPQEARRLRATYHVSMSRILFLTVTEDETYHGLWAIAGVEAVAASKFTVQDLSRWLSGKIEPPPPSTPGVSEHPAQDDCAELPTALPVIPADITMADNRSNTRAIIPAAPAVASSGLPALLATGQDDIDRIVSDTNGVTVAGTCHVTDRVVDSALAAKPEVCVLSVYLPGETDVLEVVRGLRSAGIRVVLLAGDMAPDDPVLEKIRGVHDILFAAVKPAELRARLLRPSPGKHITVAREKRAGALGRAAHLLAVRSTQPKDEKKVPGAGMQDQDGGRFRYETQPGGYSPGLPVGHTAAHKERQGTPGDGMGRDGRRGFCPCVPSPAGTEAGHARVITVAVGSPWTFEGAASLVVLLASSLAAKQKVAVVDCDLAGRGLGIRWGLSFHTSNGDWRRGGLPAAVDGAMVFALDPSWDGEVREEELEKTVGEAGRDVSWRILYAGSDPDAWWFRKACGYADVMLWVVKEEPVFLEQAKARWKQRPGLRCRELMVLFGPGDPRGMEEIFLMPCLRVGGPRDRRSIQYLGGTLKILPPRCCLRVLVVGFSGVPEIPGVLCDAFRTVAEAREWIGANPPDIAVLATGLRGAELLEHDLDIPVYKVDDLALLGELLKEIGLAGTPARMNRGVNGW